MSDQNCTSIDLHILFTILTLKFKLLCCSTIPRLLEVLLRASSRGSRGKVEHHSSVLRVVWVTGSDGPICVLVIVGYGVIAIIEANIEGRFIFVSEKNREKKWY